MSTTGIAAQEINLSLKSGFLHNGQGLRSLETYCRGCDSQLGNSFFNTDSVTMAYGLNSAQTSLTSIGQMSCLDPEHGRKTAGSSSSVLPLRASPSLLITSSPEDSFLLGVSGLSLNTNRKPDEMPPHTPEKNGVLLCPPMSSNDRSARPLPPLPVAKDLLHDEEDREVEFLTSSDTDFLLETCSSSDSKFTIQGRRSFRGCGQVNYAYFDAPAVPKPEQSHLSEQSGCTDGPCPPPPPLHRLHRRLRRSHSGPAGSFNKPAIKVSSHFRQASPSSDEDKPEVPPRVPLPPRPLKSDSRRWSAEVASGTYSDDDKPPKVPPREPLPWSHSRTPSPKSLPAYLHGVMPPTQSFAPDPKYVSSKALQRQHSEGSAHKIPCILPIIENGKKVSSTHYYLLPERPPYLDKYEMFFQETEESSNLRSERQPQGGETAKVARLVEADLGGPIKRNPLPCMVSP